MAISWQRASPTKVRVYTSRPGYTRLLYEFLVPIETTDSQVTAEVARRDVLGVRLAR